MRISRQGGSSVLPLPPRRGFVTKVGAFGVGNDEAKIVNYAGEWNGDSTGKSASSDCR